MNRQVLNSDDLAEVTGAKQKEKQAEILAKAGIYFWNRLDGSICTTWYHVNHPHIAGNSEPDYSWIDGQKTA